LVNAGAAAIVPYLTRLRESAVLRKRAENIDKAEEFGKIQYTDRPSVTVGEGKLDRGMNMARIVKEHDERRSEILDVAQELFYTKGYEKTSIKDIIDGVGIAKGTFYHYFSSKIQLLDELVERMLVQTVQMVAPIVNDETLDALEKFHLFFSTIENWKIENKAFFKGILQVFYNDDNAILRQKLKAASIAASTPALGKIIRQGINEDIFDTRYSDNIGEIIIVIGQSLAENLAVLLLGEDNNGNPLLTIEHKIAVSQYAMERLLGAPVGSVNIFDLGRLRQWFEADEIVAERSMDTQDAAAIPTA
jgi:AcrR family transcriptional regulator